MKSGFVSLIGRPNVGKSTLLNSIIGKKIVITSNKPQTTRNIIQGIYTNEETQIVFVDTPGIHKPNHKLGKILNQQAYYSINDVDIILFLVDANEHPGKGDNYIIEKLKEVNKPVILVLNKIDGMSREDILIKITEYKDLYDFKEIVPVSALKNNNVDELIKVITEYLPDSIKYYNEGETTNKNIDFIIAEIIREKVFSLTGDEVPHSLTTVVDSIEYGRTSNTIIASIIVDREALKKIVIGKQGSKIKEIGIRARAEIEELMGKKIYLDLKVKTIEKWRDSDKYLTEFGYNDFER
ncbi:MAG: GTPase Era [Bacilli bacterium]|nr:GTPase Era [Bacilli bacterium]